MLDMHIQDGEWCKFIVLEQDGPVCRKVCQVTSDLLKLADNLYTRKSMDTLAEALPADKPVGTRLGAVVGSQLHTLLYDLAVQVRESGKLEPRLKITRPTNLQLNPIYTRRGERSAAGPDFILSGKFDGEDVDAAWDFTTIGALRSHYNRDVLGIPRKRKSDVFERHPVDPSIQEPPDTVNYWSSYIAIYY
jgi:hypothetical protein